jgi:predicted kinase
MKPTLILLVGLPYSGKSTLARQLALPTVCPDEIRLALHGQRFEPRSEPFVWAIARIMVAALFGSGHDHVVLDATNTTAKRRAEWIDERWELRAIEVATPADECLARAGMAHDHQIVDVIDRMAKNYEPPTEVGEPGGTFPSLTPSGIPPEVKQ